MKRIMGFLAIAGLVSMASVPAMAADAPVCGEPRVFALTGGQTIDVGTITVSNDEEYLRVTYQTAEDWYLEEVQLYVLDYEPGERLAPGHAPYKSEDISYVRNWTFEVPLGDVACGTVLWLQAHAAVARIVDGEKVQGETAYGGEIQAGNPWYGNIEYAVQCCEADAACYEFQGETAWSDGDRYMRRGNWATYTAYVPGGTATLYAGQHLEAGEAGFSPAENGFVTISIELFDAWEFAQAEENVKIQDYASAPSGNPAPGRFEWKGTASGKSFSILVPENDFYGVHVDLGYWIEVACPEE